LANIGLDLNPLAQAIMEDSERRRAEEVQPFGQAAAQQVGAAVQQIQPQAPQAPQVLPSLPGASPAGAAADFATGALGLPPVSGPIRALAQQPAARPVIDALSDPLGSLGRASQDQLQQLAAPIVGAIPSPQQVAQAVGQPAQQVAQPQIPQEQQAPEAQQAPPVGPTPIPQFGTVAQGATPEERLASFMNLPSEVAFAENREDVVNDLGLQVVEATRDERLDMVEANRQAAIEGRPLPFPIGPYVGPSVDKSQEARIAEFDPISNFFQLDRPEEERDPEKIAAFETRQNFLAEQEAKDEQIALNIRARAQGRNPAQQALVEQFTRQAVQGDIEPAALQDFIGGQKSPEERALDIREQQIKAQADQEKAKLAQEKELFNAQLAQAKELGVEDQRIKELEVSMRSHAAAVEEWNAGLERAMQLASAPTSLQTVDEAVNQYKTNFSRPVIPQALVPGAEGTEVPQVLPQDSRADAVEEGMKAPPPVVAGGPEWNVQPNTQGTMVKILGESGFIDRRLLSPADGKDDLFTNQATGESYRSVSEEGKKSLERVFPVIGEPGEFIPAGERESDITRAFTRMFTGEIEHKGELFLPVERDGVVIGYEKGSADVPVSDVLRSLGIGRTQRRTQRQVPR
jgi:hypothetical protein